MSQYRVKMIMNDRSTYVVVMAYNATEVARLALRRVLVSISHSQW